MVTVHIDASLFTEDRAFGMVSGPINIAVVPQVGDLISFEFAETVEAYLGEHKLPFGGQLRVTDRIILANREGAVLLALEDITVATNEAAHHLLKMFEQHEGLIGDIWGHGPDENGRGAQ